jgi:hypothetical protein
MATPPPGRRTRQGRDHRVRGVMEPPVELEADDGVLPGPLGLLDSVELGVEEEEEVFVLEGEIAEVAPGLVVVLGLV